MTKRLFKLYDQSIMGHLNYMGMILFSLISILTLIFYHDLFPIKHLIIFSYIAIYIIATANINRCILPYSKKQPSLVFTSKRLLLKHLFITIRKGYLLQLLLSCLMALTFLLVLDQYLIIVLALVTVVISFLSQLTSGVFSIVIRVLFLLQFWFIITFSFKLAIIVLIIQLLIIFLYISNSHRLAPITELLCFNSSNRYSSGNILYLLFAYITNNKILVVLLGALVSVITYFGQQLFTTVQGLPALIIIYVNFMTILEILVGNKSEEIMLDRARVETLQSSLIVNSLKRFKSSSIYLISLTLIFISIFGLIGILLNTSDITIILKNLLSIPLILFIGIVYFRKTELLLSSYEYKLLRFTLPILMLICITIFTIIS